VPPITRFISVFPVFNRSRRHAWEVLSERAVTSKDYFRKYVTDPHSMNLTSGMPPHSTFDDNTFNALEAYFKAINQERN
jgi:hypothetical protein